MKIFVSHAWEDKAFARPLAESLRAAGHEVWFDEYEFKVGDSLPGKINEGLLAADFGVVVFSPDYFRKYWTKAELEALVALEARNGKMVLPVWLNIEAAEVQKKMPLLVTRYGARAERGVDAVVAELLAAMGGAEHQRQLSIGASARSRLQKLSTTLTARKAAQALLCSAEGVRLVRAEGERLIEMVTQVCTSMGTAELPISATRDGNGCEIKAPARLRLELRCIEAASISAEEMELRWCIIQLGRALDFGGRGDARPIDGGAYWPNFVADQVVWSERKDRENPQETGAVVERLVNTLVKLIESERR